jgi:RNA polymerase sigma factor (sigma-70 family)
VRDERRLARRAARGDRDAFTTIFRRFQPDLYRYCVAILADPEDAQDALQNTMVKALGALPGERREIDLKPWLYRIAHNESIDLIRRRRQTVPLEEDGLPSGPGLAEEVETRDQLRRLLADVGELPERQRGALLMREAGGLEFEEIAAALGTTPAVARQTLYEARLGLREMAAGRNMECTAVAKALSDGDRRLRRRRDIAAHLKACPECRLFAAEIDSRRSALASISPLPAVAAAALLQGLGGGSGAAVGSGMTAAGTSTAGGIGGAAAAGAGKAIGTATLLKGAATLAAVAAIGVGGADLGGFLQHRGHDGAAKAQARSVEGPDHSGGARPEAAEDVAAGREASDRPALGESAPDRPGGDRIPAGRPRSTSSIATSHRTAAPTTDGRPAGALPVEGGDDATAPAPPAEAVEHPHGRDHLKQLPARAAHGQETAAANQVKEKGKSASAPGHSGKSAPPGPATSGRPTHPDPPAKPAPREPSEPAPSPGAVPTATETAPPAEADPTEGAAPDHSPTPPGRAAGEEP